MKRLGTASLAALCLSAAAPAVASAAPSLRADPARGEVGDRVALIGRGWVVGSGCPNKVALYFQQGTRRMKLGTATHGDGSFSFRTHYQEASAGPARFVARQVCDDGVYRRTAYVTIGGDSDESVRYRGQTEHGGRVSFVVVDGNEVRDFRFMNRCSTDRRRGSRVPGSMAIGDVSFSRRGHRFTIFGRFRADGVVRGTAREREGGCDSGRMTWRVERVG
jgi:hypothetical protein